MMDKFIDDLMSRMTLDEKIGQLNLVQRDTDGDVQTGATVTANAADKIRAGKVGGIFGLFGVDLVRQAQKIAVEQSRLGIPLLFGLDVIHGHRTIFPLPIALASSWDMALIEKTARAAAVEATAEGLNWVFSPMVDIARDPRWGRVAEGAGEDPYLGAAVAKAMVQGYQDGDMSRADTVMACVKHLALYGAAEAGRDYNTVDMSRLRMFESYFPPYKAGIDAGAGSVMTSFNEVDGIPATGNRWLLTDVLRQDWGFNGMVVSDYTSVNEMSDHGMGDLKTVSALALKAGTDMDMVGEGYLTTLQQSLDEGAVVTADIDAACRRILEAKYKLGLFDDPFRRLDDSRASQILSDGHRRLARHAAAQSCVLLKNANDVLPLKPAATIALVGPLADSRRNMLGMWSVAGDWEKAVTLAEGMKNAGGDNVVLNYARGANIASDPLLVKKINVFAEEVDIDPRNMAELIVEAVAAAEGADVIVAAVGESQNMSGEASSRADIGLPAEQQALIRALKATGKPLVLVIFSGRPLVLEWENSVADAMLFVWCGGTEGGNGIADVLFGHENPAGKLTMTFPHHAGQIPLYYNHKRTGRPYAGKYEEGGDAATKFKSRYLDIPNEALFPFGYGLSYTRFAYSAVTLDRTELKGDVTLKASVTLTNTGTRAGAEVVQLYITDPVASVTRAIRDLKGFQKITLNPGESREVVFNITVDDLKFFDSALQYIWEPGEFIIQIGAHSAALQSATVQWRK